MSKLKIGQMAAINHISTQTLRLYDKMGLLVPEFTDKENGYRYYNIKQNAKLDMIQHFKTLGMSLKEIKELFDSKNVVSILSVLQQKSTQIHSQMEELIYQEKAIKRLIESFDRYSSSPPDGTILMEYINKRYIYAVDSGINFYDYGLDTYEEILRGLKESMQTNSLPEIYFYNAGTVLAKENFEKSHFYSTEVFVFVDSEFVGRKNVRTIDSNTYICIYCDKFEKEKQYANRLIDEIKSKGYKICGDFICEVVFEPPVFIDQSRGMLMRLQVPISFK